MGLTRLAAGFAPSALEVGFLAAGGRRTPEANRGSNFYLTHIVLSIIYRVDVVECTVAQDASGIKE